MERDESSDGEEGEEEKRGITFKRLRGLLQRISPIEELTTFLTSHKDFQVSSDIANPNRAKAHILSDLKRHFEGEVTEDHIAAADLCSLRVRQLTWTTYKLTPRNEQKHASSSSSPSGADPEQFARRLGEEVDLFAPHMHDDVLWARLRIAHLGVAVRTQGHVVYVAYCPRSRAVFASNITASLRDIIIHALETALGCEVEKTHLRGKNVKALMDMVLNRDGQGPYRDYRADTHPLPHSAVAAADEPQRRPVPSSPPLPVVVEDAEARQATEQHLLDAFGSSPMPALDQVNFRIVDSFRGGFDLGPRFECSVRFEGPNVLEGIRKLAQLGIAQPPLPHYLANLPSLCQNSFDLVNPNPDTGEQNQDVRTNNERQRQRGSKRKERDNETTTTTTSSSSTSTTTTSATSAQRRDEEANQQRRPAAQREDYGIVQRGEKRRG